MKLKKDYLAVLIVGMFLCLLIGLYLGVDFGPDLQNYHMYSGYLSVNKNRLSSDIIPTNIQGYFNPYVYSIPYLLYKSLPAKYVLGVISLIHGINLLAVYIVIRLATKSHKKYDSKALALGCALFGLFSPFFISMIGATWSDNITPIFILFGVAAITKELILIKSRPNLYLILIGGLLFGVSMGIKLTNIAFIFGLVPALIYLILNNKKDLFNYFLSTIIVILGIVLGFILINGYWMYELYNNYKNPFFPFFNNVFQSPELVSAYITTIKPWAAAQNVFDFVKYPFQWAVGVPPPSEWQFRDVRYALILLLGLMAIILGIINLKENDSENIGKSNYNIIRGFLLTWCFFSYIFWQNEFGALRYLIPFSLISGLIILYLLDLILKKIKINTLSLMIIFIGITIYNQKPPFGRLMRSDNWNRPTIPGQLLNTPYLYLNSGVSIGIPFLNKESIFIGYPYFTTDDGLTKRALNLISTNKFQARTLIDRRSESFDRVRLASLGFVKNPFDCLYFNIGPVQYESCTLNKVGTNREMGVFPFFSKIDLSHKFLKFVETSNGFYTEEPGGTWTSDNHSEIVFGAYLPRQFTLKIQAFSFNRVAKEGVNISIGNVKQHIKFKESSEVKLLDFDFSNDIHLNNKISFDIKNIYSPAELTKSTDIRKLGIHLQSVEILPYQYREYDLSSSSTINEIFSNIVGFSFQEPRGTWTNSHRSILKFNEYSSKNAILEITASSLPQFDNKEISITFGGTTYPLILNADKNVYKFRIYKSINELLFDIPFAESPKNLKINSDIRKLGIFIEKIRIIPQ